MVPRRAVDWSLGDLAIALSSGYGLVPDDWQADPIRCMLARQKGGRWAAATTKITVPRQNGKNGILEVVELFMMVVLGLKILHTAHEVKTARKAFIRLCSFFENERQFPELAALVSEIRKTNGQEAIVLKCPECIEFGEERCKHSADGSIEFIARSSGSGRGFTVDVLVCDEDQDLTDDELAALLPTIAAAPSGNPMVITTGTPPDPEKPNATKGEVARRIRQDALKKSDPNLLCFDWGAADGPLPDVDDESVWRQHNPAMGGRLNIEEARRERKMMSPEKFARERLGWWGNPERDKRGVLDLAKWADLETQFKPKTDAAVVLTIDVSPDRRSSTIGLATEGPTGRTLLVPYTAAGVTWVVPRLKELRDAGRHWLEVALHPSSQAGALIPDLVEAGIEFTALTNQDNGAACAAFQTGVTEGNYAHPGSEDLDSAVANATTRWTGEVELWDRRDRKINISPLVACSVAAYRWSMLRSDQSAEPFNVW